MVVEEGERQRKSEQRGGKFKARQREWHKRVYLKEIMGSMFGGGGGVGAHQLIKTQREERKVRGERKGVSRLINKLVKEAEKLPGDEDWRKDTSAP